MSKMKSDRKEVFEGTGRQIIRGLAGPGKKFGLYFKSHGKALVGWKLGSSMFSLNLNMCLNMSNRSLCSDWGGLPEQW